MTIVEKLEALRGLMKENNLTMYLVPTDDYHLSEYVGSYFKEREFLSGFTGSAGVLLVTLKNAYLWTDGRYFLQASNQLEGSTITLMKQGEKDVPSVYEFIKSQTIKKLIGFDGRCVKALFGRDLEDIKGAKITYNMDLVDKIWTDRPEISHEPGYELDVKYAGESRYDKIKKIQANLERKGADLTVISSLDDIMWILNLRGNDAKCNPVILSYLVVHKAKVVLYVNEDVLSSDVKLNLSKDRVVLRGYNTIYNDISNFNNYKILIDLNKTNYSLYKSINNTNKIINELNYSTELKACKNKVEQENFKRAHIKDAVAVCKFMYWLKTNVGKIEMSELSVSEKLLNFRKEQSNFKDISFGTIAGFGPHGAIVHYGPTKETDAQVTPDNFLLVDSGAHYLEGTTDITRTFALGKVSDEMKHHFTLVLKCYLALSDIKFKEGVDGRTLDLASREPLWMEGLDFNHGTGHGVGYLLNVHEGPQNIKYNRESYTFKEGMITSDEPGLYLTGKYGIRHESLTLCTLYKETEFGRFLQLEPITLVPFDLDGINKDELTLEEKTKLNNYHKKVYDTISPYLNKDEANFLKKYTKAL